MDNFRSLAMADPRADEGVKMGCDRGSGNRRSLADATTVAAIR